MNEEMEINVYMRFCAAISFLVEGFLEPSNYCLHVPTMLASSRGGGGGRGPAPIFTSEPAEHFLFGRGLRPASTKYYGL